MIPALFALLAIAQSQVPVAPTQPESAPQAERVAEIRVHGNTVIRDEAVVALAGVTVGSTLGADGIPAIAKRLRDSGRFDEVEVRKRYRTLEMDEIALVLLVHERPGVSASGQPPNVFRRMTSRLLFFPIIYYEDGYGWTYGARTTVVTHAEDGTRYSIPLSAGASKTATFDVDRTFTSGPFTRIFATGGIEQNGNPRFHVDDLRKGAHVRVERRLFDLVTVAGELGRSNITFGNAHDHTWTSAVEAKIDTRRDPMFPSDAVLASVVWGRLNGIGATSFGPSGTTIDRYSLDMRGYKRVYRQAVFALHAHYDTATGPLPEYEQWLLGGSSLRGTDPGEFVGDRRFFWSAEARVPITAPLNRARVGCDVFLDGGATALFSQRLEDSHQTESTGAGVWVILSVIPLNFDIAHSLDHPGMRFHFGTGFTF